MLAVMSFLLGSLVSGCASGQDFDSQVRAITKPYQFNLVKWELNALGEEATNLFTGGHENTDDGLNVVSEYFSNVKRIRRLESEIKAIIAGTRQGDLATLENELSWLSQKNAAAADTIEAILETQVREALSRQGIYNPVHKYTGFKIGFPPVNFELERPPHLLVISPRDRIESIREITLLPEMTQDEIESIEAKIDTLGVSSLVVGLGG